jgi:hypothetical protein
MSGYQSKRLSSQDRESGITIDGLTREQVQLLDQMWKFEHLEQLEAWTATLPPRLQQQVEQLVRMVLISHLDQLVEAAAVQDDRPYAEANDYLQRFRLP